MRLINKYLSATLLLISANLTIIFQANAHLMVAQHGTLNIIDDSVYMVLSLPISAFENVDDNGDGSLSNTEFSNHRVAMITAVQQQISLIDKLGALTLQGLLLSPVMPHDSTEKSTSQIIVMGRFLLRDTNSSLNFKVGLFAKEFDKSLLKVKVTRKKDKRSQAFVLTPMRSSMSFF